MIFFPINSNFWKYFIATFARVTPISYVLPLYNDVKYFLKDFYDEENIVKNKIFSNK